MREQANYRGRQFGLLKVTDCIVESDGTNKGGVWQCLCKCGQFINVRGYNLHWRNSCGCLGKKAAVNRGKGNRKPEQRILTINYHRYKYEMTHSGIEPISKLHWLEVVKHPCQYCGDTSVTIVDEKSCCSDCKRMKGDMNVEQFYRKLNQIVNYELE